MGWNMILSELGLCNFSGAGCLLNFEGGLWYDGMFFFSIQESGQNCKVNQLLDGIYTGSILYSMVVSGSPKRW